MSVKYEIIWWYRKIVLIIVRKTVYLHDHSKKVFMDNIEVVFWLGVSHYVVYLLDLSRVAVVCGSLKKFSREKSQIKSLSKCFNKRFYKR